MKSAYKLMREGIQSSPTSLLLLPPKMQKIVRNQFPYDVGLEFECRKDESMDISQLRKADESMEMSYDYGEVRFRLPGGSINQLIYLELQLDELKRYFHPNPESGIHYHIDCTDVKDWYKFANFCVTEMSEYILKELESWNYKGSYNRWEVTPAKTAVRLHNDYKTMEIRIGEFSFDYSYIVNKIKHCQAIVKHCKAMYEKKSTRSSGSLPFTFAC